MIVYSTETKDISGRIARLEIRKEEIRKDDVYYSLYLDGESVVCHKLLGTVYKALFQLIEDIGKGEA